MKNLLTITFLCLFFSCKDGQKETKAVVSDTTQTVVSDTIQTVARTVDTFNLSLVKQVLTVLKGKDYKALAAFIHPTEGIRFSPYGFIDTLNDKKFTAKQFLDLANQPNKPNIKWGYYDGSGEDINLKLDDYWASFVYTADFLNAEQTRLNQVIRSGNETNNIKDIYTNSFFSDSYFSGFDKKYGGMDWCSLRLVFKMYNNRCYLVGIVHDQWTI